MFDPRKFYETSEMDKQRNELLQAIYWKIHLICWVT